MTKALYIAAVALMISLSATGQTQGQTLDQAKESFELGDFEEALPTLIDAASAEPKNGLINQMAGIALFHLGREAEAARYLRLGQNESNLYLAQIAMHDYRFDDAEEFLDRYEAGFRKGKRGAIPERPEATEIRQQVDRGRTMLERVEQIVIIDSLDVDREEFFRAYRLAPSSGKLLPPDQLPRGFEAAQPTVVYASERADNIYWAMPDSAENFRIASSSMLADRSWERPVLFSDILNEGGDANYPFLMSDGVTLYYANTGENSLGGYDIFISRRDGDDFLQPQNIGMPYNSFANDYMLAIDEETGIGWWATDRNAAPDRLTIYQFIPGELRVNYPVDYPGLASRARIDSYRDTWEPGKDYTDLRRRVAAIDPNAAADRAEFHFAIPGRGILTATGQLKTEAGRRAIAQWQNDVAQLTTAERRLAALRKSYGRGQTAVADEILSLEAQFDTLRDRVRESANRVVEAETR
ncbi:MAG: hypothetical protein NC336_00605 [Clostridium sp.]|nr:hypothetical protein [Clostridium sp.]